MEGVAGSGELKDVGGSGDVNSGIPISAGRVAYAASETHTNRYNISKF
jgi:hypothetical protein